MVAYEKSMLIVDPSELVLRDLPVKPGERVRITVEVEDEARAERVEALRQLFAETQALPVAQSMTDEQISEEISAYRNG